MRERGDGYNRDLFEHWITIGGCSTRENVLIRDSLFPAQVDPFGCRVVAGDWLSPYDGAMWDKVGMSRDEAGLKQSISDIQALKEDFWKNLKLTGVKDTYNKYLEFAGRVADFLELGELMAHDALVRNESCGGHFREEYQTPEGEALRDDENFAFVSAWEFKGDDKTPELHKEALVFDNVKLSQRSYK
jgi:hypothetical protein